VVVFFSSRRRHTRLVSDWSSDVCSSDLLKLIDRKPSISFNGTGYVLPREGSAGLPVTTINLDRVKVRILRVNERNLVPTIDTERSEERRVGKEWRARWSAYN